MTYGLMLEPRAPKVSGPDISCGRRRLLSPEEEGFPVAGIIAGFRGTGEMMPLSSVSRPWSLSDGLRGRRDQSSSSVCLLTGICLPAGEWDRCCLSVGMRGRGNVGLTLGEAFSPSLN